jgi:hypothetical protein
MIIENPLKKTGRGGSVQTGLASLNAPSPPMGKATCIQKRRLGCSHQHLEKSFLLNSYPASLLKLLALFS